MNLEDLLNDDNGSNEHENVQTSKGVNVVNGRSLSANILQHLENTLDVEDECSVNISFSLLANDMESARETVEDAARRLGVNPDELMSDIIRSNKRGLNIEAKNTPSHIMSAILFEVLMGSEETRKTFLTLVVDAIENDRISKEELISAKSLLNHVKQ